MPVTQKKVISPAMNMNISHLPISARVRWLFVKTILIIRKSSDPIETDQSGNLKLLDIGAFLKMSINEYFQEQGIEVNLKYIDPSYTIRSVPANAHDSAFCLLLGHSAAHAGMTGRTNMVVSVWNHEFTHVPISLAVSQRKRIDPEGWLWRSVLTSTGQPKQLLQ